LIQYRAELPPGVAIWLATVKPVAARVSKAATPLAFTTTEAKAESAASESRIITPASAPPLLPCVAATCASSTPSPLSVW
jgi:hypothetical protein